MVANSKFCASYNAELTQDAVKALIEETGTTHSEFLLKAVQALRKELNGSLSSSVLESLSKEDRATVDEALKVSRLTMQELMQQGLLAIARKYVSQEESKRQRGFYGKTYRQLTEMPKTTLKGLAEAKINKAFEMIQEFNKDQVDNSSKIFTDKSTLSKITNSNLYSITKWLEDRAIDVETANEGIKYVRGLDTEDLLKMLDAYMDR